MDLMGTCRSDSERWMVEEYRRAISVQDTQYLESRRSDQSSRWTRSAQGHIYGQLAGGSSSWFERDIAGHVVAIAAQEILEFGPSPPVRDQAPILLATQPPSLIPFEPFVSLRASPCRTQKTSIEHHYQGHQLRRQATIMNLRYLFQFPACREVVNRSFRRTNC